MERLRELLPGDGSEQWRSELLEACIARGGGNNDVDAWWIPELRVEACPLFQATRAAFVPRQRMPQDIAQALADDDESGSIAQVLGEALDDEADEMFVRAKVATLLKQHLSCYSSTLWQDGAELQRLTSEAEASGVAADPVEAASLHLLMFEKALLMNHVKNLERGGANVN